MFNLMRKARQKMLNPVLAKQDKIIQKLDFLLPDRDKMNQLQQAIEFQFDTTYEPFDVEYDTSVEKLDKIVSHIETEWSKYGNDEAYWSVLVSEQFLKLNLNTRNVAAFYDTGRDTVRQIEMTLRRCGEWDTMCKDTCLEYGCGVGRVTLPLAGIFDSVTGLDISHGHIALAEERAANLGVKNISFKKVTRLK
ncbi:MAG: class I SAM-dependent methyltransferase, partial [Treponema sp.]|nr:class I SAM-dependent methyltransferase [Treponema sp.]